MTHIIMPVGLSEIPVLVAAYRLCCHFYTRDGVLPVFSLLCFPDTLDEAERVRLQLLTKLREDKLLMPSASLNWDPEVISSTKPETVLERVEEIAKKVTHGCVLHLHYTADARFLVIPASEALVNIARRDATFIYEMSYFEPQENVLRGGKGAIIGDVQDERLGWNLSIATLSRLNNFTPEFYSRREKRFFRITEPDPDVLAIAAQMIALLKLPENYQTYSNWLRDAWDSSWRTDIDGKWKDWNRWPQPPPRNRWPRKPLSWPRFKNDHAWTEVTLAMKRCFGGENVWITQNGQISIDLANLTEDQLSRLNQFLHHQYLELFAYESLRLALHRLGFARFPVYHSLRFARMSTGTPYRDFEVDLASVIGYQLLAVSCSMSADQSMLKRKAFEVLHRARQVGGDNARTILLCTLAGHDARELFADVQEDTGPGEETLQIWGADVLDDLPQRFEAYLQNHIGLRPRITLADQDYEVSGADQMPKLDDSSLTYLGDSVIRRIRMGEFPNQDEAGGLYRQSLMRVLSLMIQPCDIDMLLDFIDTESGARAGFACGLLRHYSTLPSVKDRLLRTWGTADPLLRASLLWRILDDQTLSIERHQDLFEFIQGNYRVCREHQLAYFETTSTSILRGLKERYTSPDVPLSKKWAYLCIAGFAFRDSPGAQALVEMGHESPNEFTQQVAATILRSWFSDQSLSRSAP